jgi:hypothetical protein
MGLIIIIISVIAMLIIGIGCVISNAIEMHSAILEKNKELKQSINKFKELEE